ncbi:fused MFS/spermidine synthase [Bacteroidota bacterium]
MHRISTLWKANIIAFISSFCVMVIELIAARLLAPHIGVSLYTWTSIIGVILGGIALGNYLGGKLADKHPSPLFLALIFFTGALLTIVILPSIKVVTTEDFFGNLPVMWNFILKTACIFFMPAIVLSMVSPMVIKLALADLGKTGGVVGTIYAVSTTGAILGTFMTGFYFILWFGTNTIVWLVAIVLFLTGIVSWFAWRVPGRWSLSLMNIIIGASVTLTVLISFILFELRESWRENYTRESNYFAIRVLDGGNDIKVLVLDHLVHSYINPNEPTALDYYYLKVFKELVTYSIEDNNAPRVLHLGGGGYSFPRYLEAIYPASVNEVVEIDPVVTQVAYEELGLPSDTSIKTHNQDARLFLIQRRAEERYDVVIGDVFNDYATPFHLTTLEFNQLVKFHMTEDGIYLLNLIDDYERGRYMASFIHTLRQTFNFVYLLSPLGGLEFTGTSTFVLAATDKPIDIDDYKQFVTEEGNKKALAIPHDENKLEEYLSKKNPILLIDDYVPTDILAASLLADKHE